MDDVSTTKSTSEKSTPHSSSSLLGWFSLLIALVALAIGGLNLYNIRNLSQYPKTFNQQFLQLNNKFKEQLQQLEKQSQTQTDTLNQLTKKIEQPKANDWKVKEAFYLTKLAYYQIEIIKNPDTALQLLNAAKNSLNDLVGQPYTSLRKKFIDSISQLQAVPALNIEDILQKIEAINKIVNSIPIHHPEPQKLTKQTVIKKNKGSDKTSKTSEKKSQSTKTVLKNALSSSWDELKQVIVIKRHDKPITPLLSDNEQAYLLQNIHLLLQQTQWAVLNKQQSIFQKSLGQVKALITQYFSEQNEDIISVLKNIDTLSKINLEPKLPNLTDLLQSLQKTIKKTPSNENDTKESP